MAAEKTVAPLSDQIKQLAEDLTRSYAEGIRQGAESVERALRVLKADLDTCIVDRVEIKQSEGESIEIRSPISLWELYVEAHHRNRCKHCHDAKCLGGCADGSSTN